MRISLLLLVVCFVAVAGCGGDGSSPSSPSSTGGGISGTWSGQIASRDWGTLRLQVSLAQSGSTITGSYTSPDDDDVKGSISGSLNGSSFAGTMTILGCNGGASVSGAVSGNQIALTSGQGFIINGFECDSDRAGFTATLSRAS